MEGFLSTTTRMALIEGALDRTPVSAERLLHMAGQTLIDGIIGVLTVSRRTHQVNRTTGKCVGSSMRDSPSTSLEVSSLPIALQ